MNRYQSTCLVSLACLAATAAFAQQGQSPVAGSPAGLSDLTVIMKDNKGKSAGIVLLREFEHGLVLNADLKGLPPGPHGFHIHERGLCEGPGFQSAGGHFNPLHASHGYGGGMHAGDLPNIHVHADGTAKAEFFAAHLTLKRPRIAETTSGAASGAGSGTGGGTAEGGGTAMTGPFPLLDGDGSAIVVHEKADDYRDMDSAGSRIACGVIGTR